MKDSPKEACPKLGGFGVSKMGDETSGAVLSHALGHPSRGIRHDSIVDSEATTVMMTIPIPAQFG